MTCKHLGVVPLYPYNPATPPPIPPQGKPICNWGDNNPERLLNAPRWLTDWALAGGPTFNPAKHCPNCLGHEKEP